MLNFLLTHTPLLYLTQSLWRDEAYSILVAQKPIAFFFGKLTFEPPLYYILLHFWMKLFGTSEIAARSLSLVAFMFATIVVIVWAEKLFGKHWLAWFLPIFFFLNPMLLYYAFEVRTYGWYILFATVSLFAYMEKKWRWYVAATVLGFYTHSFFILLPFVQGVHYLFTHRKIFHIRHITSLFIDPMIQSLVSIGLLTSPWLLVIMQASRKLTSSWYYPVDFHLIRSVLGNIFFGYEGTPAFLWPATAGVSIILLMIFLFTLTSKETRRRNFFFFLAIFIPLIIVIGISFIKPLFVNRYLIPVTIAQVFLISFAIEKIQRSALQKFAGLTSLVIILGANIIAPSFHKKIDIRNTMMQINALKTKQDIIFAQTPLVLFESMYYSKEPSRVFLYNPNDSAFPWYVGDIIITPSVMATSLPAYPIRAFLVKEDGSFMVVYQTSVTAKPRTTPIRK